MLAIDTSAIIALLNTEAEDERLPRLIATSDAVVGASTLVEARLVLEGRTPGQAKMLLHSFTCAVPLLFKANDFGHTDVVPADTPTP